MEKENKTSIDNNQVKKDLYKSKAMAKFSHYVSGNLYYTIETLGDKYQFPISTIDVDYIEPLDEGEDEREIIILSEDLGTTSFEAEMKGSELNRWIQKAIEKDEFIKVG